MTQETHRLRDAGLLTSGAVTKALGISLTTLRRLEGKLFAPVPRDGKRRLRVFTPEQVEKIRETLRSATRFGPESNLLYLEEVAQRAGCHVQTIRPRLGHELPVGRRIAHPRPGRGFTLEEAEQTPREEIARVHDVDRRARERRLTGARFAALCPLLSLVALGTRGALPEAESLGILLVPVCEALSFDVGMLPEEVRRRAFVT